MTTHTRYTDYPTVAAWLESYGFEHVATNQGQYSAYIRDHGDVRETITLSDDDVSPDLWTDHVDATTDDTATEYPPFTDAHNIPMWALRDMIDGCDCYELWGLRIANSQADAHDADCKRFQG